MHIVLGATGQVGSAVVEELVKKKQPVKAVIRNPEKARKFKDRGIDVAIADFFDLEALKRAFSDGDTVILLTPENIRSGDIFAETDILLKNYREAILYSKIKKVVGLSSGGAQHKSGTGNLVLSYRLEHTLNELPLCQTYIRPAYFYSNWMPYYEMVREQGVLPTFFPFDQKIPMISPLDVAAFVAEKMVEETTPDKVYELTGPDTYSSADVANTFGEVLGRKVEVQQIPRERWKETFTQAGFSDNAADNFIKMTEFVVKGKASWEKEQQDLIKLPATLKDYLKLACQAV